MDGNSESKYELTIVGAPDDDDRSRRSRRVTLDPEGLSKEVLGFVEVMNTVLASASESTKEFHLSQVQISAEISATGKLSIFGTGAEVSGKGGLVFTFHRTKLPTHLEPTPE